MDNYTGREIAIFTDVHGLYEPLLSILDDIKSRGIKEIYSLGDNIGVGPNPSEVLELLFANNVKLINGNNEEYVLLGIDPFSHFFCNNRIKSHEWTLEQLSQEQIEKLKNGKHSYDLLVGGKKIGLCHFGNDVRIDFENSTWSYQTSINYDLSNAQKQFYYTNSDEQKEIIDRYSVYDKSLYAGFVSAKKDPLFGGKTVDNYDELIQGHVHYKFLTEDDKLKIRTIRAVGMAYGDQPLDFASYIIIKEKNIGYDVEEILVPFDREAMLNAISNSTMPYKEKINKYVCK